jgi:hypothetical protein
VYRTKGFLLALAALCLGLLSCNPPDTVAKFCASAVVTLKSGDSLLDDMQASCVREVQTREAIGEFTASDPHPEVCANIGKQSDELKAASKILASYFTALNDLASFGTSKAGDGVGGLVARVSGQGRMSSESQKALGAIGGFLTRVATSSYQQKHLAEDIVKVRGDIRVALAGLGEAVGVVYRNQLQDEEVKTGVRYKEFALEHKGSAEVLVQLDSRWQSDRAVFAAKRAAASCYEEALETLVKGNEDLADHARGFRAKELAGLLSPYTEQLESLLPAIQKAWL